MESPYTSFFSYFARRPKKFLINLSMIQIVITNTAEYYVYIYGNMNITIDIYEISRNIGICTFFKQKNSIATVSLLTNYRV